LLSHRLTKVLSKSLQSRFPELAIETNPLGGVLHGPGRQATTTHAPRLVALDQAGALEDGQVLQNGRQGDAMPRRQIGHRSRAARQPPKDVTPRRVSQGCKGLIQAVRIVYHVVKYTLGGQGVKRRLIAHGHFAHHDTVRTAARRCATKRGFATGNLKTMTAFGDRLTTAVRRRGTPVVVGLDPRFRELPPVLLSGRGDDPASRASGYLDFCRGVIDVVASLVPAVKPQTAFFEELGPPGMAALAAVVRHAREAGLLVIIDAKRHDIGSTAAAYAQAFLGPPDRSAWGGDALTVGPYLGEDSLAPFVEVAIERAAGVFVLVKTSNPGSATIQDLRVDGEPLYRHVAELVERLSAAQIGECGYGSVGAVVGATYARQLTELRRVMPHAWFLVPGYGHQGAEAKDVAGAFDDSGLGAVVNSSRGIIFAHSREPFSERYGHARWQEAVEAATRDMIEALRAETRAGRLPIAPSSD